MSNYLGYECIVCGQKFNENDDIVVCPDCGTPYHRDCYIKSGKCVNEKLHETGESWRGSVDSGSEKSGYKKCPYCETMNKPHTIICEHCGAPLVGDLNKNMSSSAFNQNFGRMNESSENNGMFGNTFSFDPNDKCCGMDPEEEFESIKLKELADFVKTNQLYYLPIFKKIKDTGQKISLNIISFLFPQLYFANRKMWFWTVISIVLTTLLSIPYMIYMIVNMDIFGGIVGSIDIESKSFGMIYNATSFINFAFKALMLIFSNWLYYRHALNKIRQKKLTEDSVKTENFSVIGGTSLAAVFISFAAQMVLTCMLFLLLTK